MCGCTYQVFQALRLTLQCLCGMFYAARSSGSTGRHRKGACSHFKKVFVIQPKQQNTWNFGEIGASSESHKEVVHRVRFSESGSDFGCGCSRCYFGWQGGTLAHPLLLRFPDFSFVACILFVFFLFLQLYLYLSLSRTEWVYELTT